MTRDEMIKRRRSLRKWQIVTDWGVFYAPEEMAERLDVAPKRANGRLDLRFKANRSLVADQLTLVAEFEQHAMSAP
jgi:hypothetical protein